MTNCNRCDDSGVIAVTCRSCHGNPAITNDEDDIDCSTCGGDGYEEAPCPECNGSGESDFQSDSEVILTEDD
ncbi:hypothetical protein [Agarivorans sp. 1_MG-2023]|uniref:hypothetical protein n=1 Tax=Agarivorans sp. 1_MG-2023 TaxID=3062634 RepID=UPI0026E291A4|nr:hypothetical protein [Agarivorans sp. 1_MG-2023]MDO6765204.1 hypothetical protein [Agarivorans sp. 1_MG-2023]